jgi:hypothetical protein
MPRTPSPVSNYLSRGGSLPLIQRRLAEQERLLQLVRQLLPDPVGNHCLAAVMRDGQLTLLSDSSAWASRLRFASNNLLQQLRQRGMKCSRAKVKIVIQGHQAGRRRPRPARQLSPENGKLLRTTAEHIEDRDLREALLRLSRHTGG